VPRIAQPRGPRDLPELRGALLDSEIWSLMGDYESYTGRADFRHPEEFYGSLAEAQLWWLGGDAQGLVQHAAPSMPPATLTEELMPDEHGFLAFEHPFEGIDAEGGPSVTVHFLQWLPTTVIDHDSVSIIAWGLTASPAAGGYIVVPLGRTDWLMGTDSDLPVPGATELSVSSMAEDRRLLAALWIMSAQAGLMESTEARPDNAARKRLVRAQRPTDPVRVVNLAPRHRGSAEGYGGGRTYTHQWIVEGFWRQQAYGPGHSLHRPTYIAPYVKGPIDAPLLVREKVKSWR